MPNNDPFFMAEHYPDHYELHLSLIHFFYWRSSFGVHCPEPSKNELIIIDIEKRYVLVISYYRITKSTLATCTRGASFLLYVIKLTTVRYYALKK